MDDIRHRRATSFGGVAGAYVRGRPGYPASAIEWMLASAPGPQVIDLGAGTGKLTEGLVALGLDVTAVEPLAGMREQFAAVLPDVPVLEGTAEHIPVPGESADAVVAAQAFHWFDPVPSLTEIARVLRPGGMLGLLWNTRDDAEPWVAELTRILKIPVESASRWDWSDGAPLTSSPLFEAYEQRPFPHRELYTPERLVDWARSTSTIAIMDPADHEQRLEQIAEMCRTHPDLRGRDEFPMPMVTMTIRARRAG
jgi:SAM-dependent methyltransferase